MKLRMKRESVVWNCERKKKICSYEIENAKENQFDEIESIHMKLETQKRICLYENTKRKDNLFVWNWKEKEN